jgi:hypothetical protein
MSVSSKYWAMQLVLKKAMVARTISQRMMGRCQMKPSILTKWFRLERR